MMLFLTGGLPEKDEKDRRDERDKMLTRRENDLRFDISKGGGGIGGELYFS